MGVEVGLVGLMVEEEVSQDEGSMNRTSSAMVGEVAVVTEEGDRVIDWARVANDLSLLSGW